MQGLNLRIFGCVFVCLEWIGYIDAVADVGAGIVSCNGIVENGGVVLD